MKLYLVRHAIAHNRDPSAWPDDRRRPLTSAGMARFERAARGLRVLAADVDVVLSSRYTRAWQTAEILQRHAGWPRPRECAALEQDATPDDVLAVLQPHANVPAVALIGHEPNMHELASYLLTGDAGRVYLEFKKGGAACFQLRSVAAGEAEQLWLATPAILRALRGDN
jgi:phosphohistidine phosphatase